MMRKVRIKEVRKLKVKCLYKEQFTISMLFCITENSGNVTDITIIVTTIELFCKDIFS